MNISDLTDQLNNGFRTLESLWGNDRFTVPVTIDIGEDGGDVRLAFRKREGSWQFLIESYHEDESVAVITSITSASIKHQKLAVDNLEEMELALKQANEKYSTLLISVNAKLEAFLVTEKDYCGVQLR